jgi:outer membrane protein assembly factor BamD
MNTSFLKNLKMQTQRLGRLLGHASWLLAAALVLQACSGKALTDDKTINWTPEKLYAEAKDEANSARWAEALKLLERLESRYPFGRFSQQAQIDRAYIHYRENEPGLALATIDRFMRLHPNHPQMDYMFYLQGLINFNENQGFLANIGGQDLSERDLKAARESFESFRQLSARFPNSKYATEAEGRMQYLRNSMAAGEVHIARYYFRRGAYVAAANRAQLAIKGYQETPAIEEALAILTSSYDRLGLDEQKEASRRVLERTFPKSKYLVQGMTFEERSWWQVWK